MASCLTPGIEGWLWWGAIEAQPSHFAPPRCWLQNRPGGRISLLARLTAEGAFVEAAKGSSSVWCSTALLTGREETLAVGEALP